MKLRGKTIRVEPFDGVFSDWYALVTDDATGKQTEGPIRHLKLHAWFDGIILAFK